MSPFHRHMAAVLTILFDSQGRILLASPNPEGPWRAVGGGMKDESVVECMERELHEELGPEVCFTFYDILDAHRFQSQFGPLISIWALARYDSGPLVPADDLAGYHLRWLPPEEIEQAEISAPQQREILLKAVFMVKTYLDHPELPFLKFKWSMLT